MGVGGCAPARASGLGGDAGAPDAAAARCLARRGWLFRSSQAAGCCSAPLAILGVTSLSPSPGLPPTGLLHAVGGGGLRAHCRGRNLGDSLRDPGHRRGQPARLHGLGGRLERLRAAAVWVGGRSGVPGSRCPGSPCTHVYAAVALVADNAVGRRPRPPVGQTGHSVLHCLSLMYIMSLCSLLWSG